MRIAHVRMRESAQPAEPDPLDMRHTLGYVLRHMNNAPIHADMRSGDYEGALDDAPGRGPTPVESFDSPTPIEIRNANLVLVMTRTGHGWGYFGVAAAIENLRSGRIAPADIVSVQMRDGSTARAGAALEENTLVVRTAEHGEVLSLELGRVRT